MFDLGNGRWGGLLSDYCAGTPFAWISWGGIGGLAVLVWWVGLFCSLGGIGSLV